MPESRAQAGQLMATSDGGAEGGTRREAGFEEDTLGDLLRPDLSRVEGTNEAEERCSGHACVCVDVYLCLPFWSYPVFFQPG